MNHRFNSIEHVICFAQRLLLALCLSSTLVAYATPSVKLDEPYGDPSAASISILLDNYDVWANEVIKESSLKLISESADMSDQVSSLKEIESQADIESRKSLQSLAFDLGETSVAFEAAILLSKRTTGKDRASALSRAYRLAQALRPQSEEALRVLLMLSLHHLLALETQQAALLRPDLERLISDPRMASSSLACKGRLLMGDIFFSVGDFGRSGEEYERSSQCRSAQTFVDGRESSRLILRQVWVAFRLSRYDEALSFLVSATPLITLESRSIQEALTEDLAHVLGVSLSEMAPSIPSSHWSKNAATYDWIARGLIQGLLYLARSDRSELALQWFESLEPSLRSLRFAPEFYAAGLAAAQQSGRIDRLNDLKMRTVISLRIGGAFGLSVGSLSGVNRRRADMVERLSRDVADTFSGLNPETLGKTLPLRFAQVIDAFLGEKISVCKESKTLIQSHRFLAAAEQTALSERIRALLLGCSLPLSDRAEVMSAHSELLRSRWKRSSRSSIEWENYYKAILSLVSDFSGIKLVRQIALEAATDALSLERYQDSQRLADAVFSTLSTLKSDEDRQFETDAIVSLMAMLLARQPTTESTELLAWDMKTQFLPSLGRLNRSYRELESSLAAAAQSKSNVLRARGDFLAAVERLRTAASRLGQESVVGRDLMFMATRLSCTTGLDDQCLALSAFIATAQPYAPEDRFVAARWRSAVLRSRGRLLRAADTIREAAEDAVSSDRNDIIALAHADLLEAGRVYSDLHLWKKAIEVRSVLVKIAPRVNRLRKTVASVVDWSLKAIDQGSFVVAAELSSGLNASPGGGIANSFATAERFEPVFADLVVGYARYRSRVGTAEELDQVLTGLSGLYRSATEKRLGTAIYSSGRYRFIDEVISFRYREILGSYKASQPEARQNSDRLLLIRSDRQKVTTFCDLARTRSMRSLPTDAACLSNFSALALDVLEGMQRSSRLGMSRESSAAELTNLRDIDSLSRSLKAALVAQSTGLRNVSESRFTILDKDAVSQLADRVEERSK